MICPYFSTMTKQCTHKLCKPNKSRKRVCEFKYPHNCELFNEWVESRIKINKVSENALYDDYQPIENKDEDNKYMW